MTNDELRFALLKLTYEASEKGKLPLQTAEYLQELGPTIGDGDTVTRVGSALEYLMDRGLIVASRLPAMNDPTLHLVKRITSKGTDAIENPKGHPEVVSSPVHFYGPIGAVQIGNQNTAQVTQNIGADLNAFVDALTALRNVAASNGHIAVEILAASAIDEASTKRTVTDKLRSILPALGPIIQTSAALIPAYRALCVAASAVGINLPPPPASGS